MSGRKPYRTPKLAALVTVADLAKEAGIPKRTFAWRLSKLWERDVAQGHGDWRYQLAADGKILINRERLVARHPALLQRRYVARREFESLIDRVEGVEAEQRRVRIDQRAVRRDFAELRDRVNLSNSGQGAEHH